MALFSKGIILRQMKEPAFSGPLVRFVSSQSDGDRFTKEEMKDPDLLDADEIIEIARAANIVDERDGKLLYRKLLRAKDRAVAVVVDAVDDEPYVSSQINPMLKLREEAAGGVRMAQQVAGTEQILLLAYRNLTDLQSRLPRAIEGIPITRLRGGYPAEPTAAKLNVGAGRKLIVGVCSLIHLYRAATLGRRQNTVFVTVAGNSVANPMNLEVSIGTTIAQVLEKCGLISEPTRLVNGGAMTGKAVQDPHNTVITHRTRAILAMRESKADSRYQCIGCGRCERACPMGLNPMYIYRFVEHSNYSTLERFDPQLCIGCGTCSYLCPSKLNVAGAALRARQYMIEHRNAGTEEEEEPYE